MSTARIRAFFRLVSPVLSSMRVVLRDPFVSDFLLRRNCTRFQFLRSSTLQYSSTTAHLTPGARKYVKRLGANTPGRTYSKTLSSIIGRKKLHRPVSPGRSSARDISTMATASCPRFSEN
eukprot:748328-Hanusia_phi.AAC.6